MSQRYQIRFGGYGPPSTSFSRALKRIGDDIEAKFGRDVDIKYIYNIMDLGFKGKDILWLTENGFLTISYQSSSYLTDRVPELGFVDLPFLFADNTTARAAIDGSLGLYLTQKTEDRFNYKILGYFENGFRQISNNLRPIYSPNDLKNMKIRVMLSDTHVRTFELLGAIPKRLDLTEAISGIKDGSLDAQENPLTNTVTYDVHKHHKHHTISNHFYVSRSIMCNRTAYYSWPEDLKNELRNAAQKAIKWQRKQADKDVEDANKKIRAEGHKIIELSAKQIEKFREKIRPQYEEARNLYGNELFDILNFTYSKS
ncbi:MAG: TRAP transporter substrate-binding protein [Pseudomonadota bacterium]|nr:TRAP transporter substrate-binding protein [Pseudomonadota bacterium]